MDVDAEFESLGLPAAKESHAWEARAKITWGDRPDEVTTWLVANGIDQFTADHIVHIAVCERARSMRLKGIRDLAIGLVLLGVAAGIAASMIAAMRAGIPMVRGRGMALVLAGCALAGLYGLNLTWRGLERIIAGSRAEGAVSDVDEF